MPQMILAQIASRCNRAAALLVLSGIVDTGHIAALHNVAAISRLEAPVRVFDFRRVVVGAVNDLGTIRVKIVKEGTVTFVPFRTFAFAKSRLGIVAETWGCWFVY